MYKLKQEVDEAYTALTLPLRSGSECEAISHFISLPLNHPSPSEPSLTVEGGLIYRSIWPDMRTHELQVQTDTWRSL